MWSFVKRMRKRKGRDEEENRENEAVVIETTTSSSSSSRSDLLPPRAQPGHLKITKLVDVDAVYADVDDTPTRKKKHKCFRKLRKFFRKLKSRKNEKDEAQKAEESKKVELKKKKQEEDLERLTCPICLDIMVGPHRCHPCQHVFCVLCLRDMHSCKPGQINCALCRGLVEQEMFSRDLDREAQARFPEEYFAKYIEVNQSRTRIGGEYTDHLRTHFAYRWHVLKRTFIRWRPQV